ncbi:DNA binding domain-containing protein, excisionase family [Methylobacterium sp. 174MFSha1.1]|nr:DNA binding domain-containing protein, excisionase family [Methylobacterium sp. 174MFSha1.1]
MPRPPGRPPQTPLQPVDTRQQAVDAAVARVVENITANLKAMIPEHAIRRLIELEVRAAVQALPPVMVERAAAPQVPQAAPQPQTRPRTEPGPALAPERLTYRVEEVAEIMGVTDSTVWKWLRESGLPSRRINRVRLIRRVDLEAFIDAMPASRGGPKDE